MSPAIRSNPLSAAVCDCHVHVFDPLRFAYAPERAYTPGPAGLQGLRKLHAGLGVSRVVLVQPSVYGTDNACLLDALAQRGADTARGVAVLDPAVAQDAHLDRLHAAGVRGLRLNLQVSGGDLQAVRQQLTATARLAQGPGWHVQVHAPLAVHVALLPDYEALDLPVVLDHFAGGLTASADSERLLGELLAALPGLPLHIKLSAAYRLWPGCDASVLARRFHAAAPERVVWGTDWPHTGGSGGQDRKPQDIEPFRTIDNPQALAQLLSALGSERAACQLLVDNPERLYGFQPTQANASPSRPSSAAR